MTLFITDIRGHIEFGDSTIHKRPLIAIDITEYEHQQYLLAQHRGATISIVNDRVVLTKYDGSIIDHTKVTEMSDFNPPVTIVQKAAEEIAWCRQESSWLVARGKTFSPAMVEYIQHLENIVSGKDSVTKVLPVRPTMIS